MTKNITNSASKIKILFHWFEICVINQPIGERPWKFGKMFFIDNKQKQSETS